MSTCTYVVMCICDCILRIAVCMADDNPLYITLDVCPKGITRVQQGCVCFVNL